MYTLCICAVFLVDPAAQAGAVKDPFKPENLVRATCIRVGSQQRDPRRQTATFRINYVYCGDAKLNNTTFKTVFLLDERASNGIFDVKLSPPMEEGEEGIWYLMPLKDVDDLKESDGFFVPVYNRGQSVTDDLTGWHLAIPVPARKIIGEQDIYSLGGGSHVHYLSALRWADAVEKVAKVNRVERLKMLREYAFSSNPYVAAWALRMLAEYKPDDLIPFLEKLADDPKVSVAAQVTLDDLLCRIHWKKWHDSKRRGLLLQRWVSGDIRETSEVLIIAARIQSAFHLLAGNEATVNQMDWRTWLPLMDKWVSQNHLSPALETRLYHFDQEVRFPRHSAQEVIFSYVSNVLEKSKDPRRQRFAAKWLTYLRLTDRQVAIVKKLKEKAANPTIGRLLDEAIKDSEGMP